jgi:hypothetical protein
LIFGFPIQPPDKPHEFGDLTLLCFACPGSKAASSRKAEDLAKLLYRLIGAINRCALLKQALHKRLLVNWSLFFEQQP